MKILLVVYDNNSFVPFFPLGTAYIASALRKEGHEVEIYSQDVYHYSDKHLTNYLNNNGFDMVGLGIIAGYTQYRKFIKLSEAINNSEKRDNFIYVIAGTMVTPEPKFFLEKMKADVAVLGEGEETIVELLNKKFDCKGVKGVAYRKNGEVFVNERREPIKNIDEILFPAYDMFPIDFYKLMRFPGCEVNDYVMPILSGRGCTFKCNYCFRMDKGFRPRSPEKILEEVEYLKSNFGINYIVFGDELLMSSVNRTVEVCELFLKSKIKFKWACEGRLNFAKLDALKLMKEAGCVYVDYGIEAFDDKMLKVMKKGLTTKMIVEGVENTLKVGLNPGLNFIFGNINETKEVLEKDVKFLLKYSDCVELRTIRPVTPYPGSPLYYYAIEKGLIKDVEDFYENKLINSDLVSVNFTEYTEEEFHNMLYQANCELIKKYYDYHKKKTLDICDDLYHNKNKTFRGFRPVI